jgi:hypothetical protein
VTRQTMTKAPKALSSAFKLKLDRRFLMLFIGLPARCVPDSTEAMSFHTAAAIQPFVRTSLSSGSRVEIVTEKPEARLKEISAWPAKRPRLDLCNANLYFIRD